MPDNDIYYMQVQAEDDLQDALKGYAAFNHLSLRDVFVEAVERFIGYRHRLHSNKVRVPYLAGPRGGRMLSIKLPNKLGNRAQALAREDGATIRPFVYTALVHYAVHHNLIPPVAPVRSVALSDNPEPSMLEIARRKRDQ